MVSQLCHLALFYLRIIENFKNKWDALLFERKSNLAASSTSLYEEPVTIDGDTIYIGKHRLSSGNKLIIDNVFIWAQIFQLSSST